MPAATRGQRAPTRLARGLIALSVTVLPKSARARYRREFIADLHELSRVEQAGYALHVLAGSVPLRLAVRGATRTSPAEAIDMTTRQGRPLLCWLTLHHDWHGESAEDGTRYQRCRRCGKDATGPVTIRDDDMAAQAKYTFGIGSGF